MMKKLTYVKVELEGQEEVENLLLVFKEETASGNWRFISFIFYYFLLIFPELNCKKRVVVKMVSVSFSRDLENKTISIEDDKSENYIAEDVTDVVAKLIADWAISTGVVILDSH